jgi:hypothetical protein
MAMRAAISAIPGGFTDMKAFLSLPRLCHQVAGNVLHELPPPSNPMLT